MKPTGPDFSRSNVIDLGEHRFTKTNTNKHWTMRVGKDCQHPHVTLDNNGDIVTCDDCKKQVSAYWVLGMVVDQWKKWSDNLKHRADQVAAVEAKNVVLKAAQLVEKAWRSKGMVPTCPHCDAAILPEDGFGRCNTNKEWEMARRRKLAADRSPSKPSGDANG